MLYCFGIASSLHIKPANKIAGRLVIAYRLRLRCCSTSLSNSSEGRMSASSAEL